MANSLAYSLAILFCIISASHLVFGADPLPDGCQNVTKTLSISNKLKGCIDCVSAQFAINSTCIFLETRDAPGIACQQNSGAIPVKSSVNETDCEKNYSPTPTPAPAPPPPITTPAPSPSPNTTTQAPTPTTTAPASTNGSTTLKPTTPEPITNATTLKPGSSTTAVPTTKGPASTPAPAAGGGGGFSFPTFLGGIVFTLAISSLGYVVFRFYKARTARNYSNLSPNLF